MRCAEGARCDRGLGDGLAREWFRGVAGAAGARRGAGRCARSGPARDRTPHASARRGGVRHLYRRAAWAAREDVPDDPGAALEILGELLEAPETQLDVFAGQRAAGQILFGMQEWEAALSRFEVGLDLARRDPQLVDRFGLSYVSAGQHASMAAGQAGRLQYAADLLVELRDHPSFGIPQRSRQTVAFSAARAMLRAGNLDGTRQAWDRARAIAPDRFEGPQGVLVRLERARALADLSGSLMPLEELWGDPRLEAHHTGLEVAFELAARYARGTEEHAESHALDVLLEARQVVREREGAWEQALDVPRRAQMRLQIRRLLARGAPLAISLERWDDASSLVAELDSRSKTQQDQRLVRRWTYAIAARSAPASGD